MLESVLTVRWLDGDRVETVWRSRGDPDPGDRRFHSSSKPAGDRVHINAQVTTIWAADVPAMKRAIAVPVGGTALGDYRRRPAAAERASARRHSALYAEAEVGHEARRLQVTDSACPSGPRLSGSSPIHERCRSRYRGISRTARGTDARRNSTSPRTRHTARPSPDHLPQHRRTPGPWLRRNRGYTRSRHLSRPSPHGHRPGRVPTAYVQPRDPG